MLLLYWVVIDWSIIRVSFTFFYHPRRFLFPLKEFFYHPRFFLPLKEYFGLVWREYNIKRAYLNKEHELTEKKRRGGQKGSRKIQGYIDRYQDWMSFSGPSFTYYSQPSILYVPSKIVGRWCYFLSPFMVQREYWSGIIIILSISKRHFEIQLSTETVYSRWTRKAEARGSKMAQKNHAFQRLDQSRGRGIYHLYMMDYIF